MSECEACKDWEARLMQARAAAQNWMEAAEIEHGRVLQLQQEVADLRSCAHGAILDDYQETLRVLDEAGYNQGGGTLAGRVKAFIDRLMKRFSQTADKQSFSEGQELWMEWRGKFRSGHVQVIVDLGTMYVAPNLCYTSEAACRDASREPETPTVKAKKGHKP